MSQRELLENKPKNELENICKELGLPRYKGKTKLSKDELIDSILNCPDVDVQETNEENPNEGIVEVNEENVIEKVDAVEVFETEVDSAPLEIIFKDRTKYIEEAEAGTLIAFVDLKGKPRTAKLVNRSSKRREVKLITEFNWEFIVPYENVLWIRNGARWPKSILRILKEYGKNAQKVNYRQETK